MDAKKNRTKKYPLNLSQGQKAMLVVTRCHCTDVGLPTEVRPSMDLLVVQDGTFTAKITF